jgi:hypothetical protein
VIAIKFHSIFPYLQQFGAAKYVDPSFQNSGLSGLLGLGWPSISAEYVIPFVQNILTQMQQPLFTVWLNRFIKIFYLIKIVIL